MQLFRNETKEWYHIIANGEEVICTGEHPFFVAEKNRFIPAKDLKIEDRLLLSCGECVKIELIKIEKLDSPETTYNFEVADFHTYYVSESKVLVHNRCVAEIKNDPHIDHGNITGSGKYGSYDITFNDGSHYIGKGSQSRMWQSASNHEIGSLKATAVKWRPATSGRQAFMKEALWMRNYRDYGVKLLNKIASPGFKFAGWFW